MCNSTPECTSIPVITPVILALVPVPLIVIFSKNPVRYPVVSRSCTFLNCEKSIAPVSAICKRAPACTFTVWNPVPVKEMFESETLRVESIFSPVIDTVPLVIFILLPVT